MQSEVGKDYLWDSYWWTSGVYASSYICQALTFFKGNSIGGLVDETLKALSKNQRDEGYFVDGLGKPSAFFTATNIKCLLFIFPLLFEIQRTWKKSC